MASTHTSSSPQLPEVRFQKSDLDRETSQVCLRPTYEVSRILSAAFSVMSDQLRAGKAVVLPGIGKLSPVYRKRQIARKLPMPQGGTFEQKPHASMGVKFKISARLKAGMPKVDPDDTLYQPEFDPYSDINNPQED